MGATEGKKRGTGTGTGKGKGKRKIEIKRIDKDQQRIVTFSKRRQGLFKKAHALHQLTGAQVAVLVVSAAGRAYSHGDPSFDAIVDRYLDITDTAGAGAGAGAAATNDNRDDDQEEARGPAASELIAWLDAIRVDEDDSVEDLIFLKEKLEAINHQVMRRMIEENYFV